MNLRKVFDVDCPYIRFSAMKRYTRKAPPKATDTKLLKYFILRRENISPNNTKTKVARKRKAW